MIHADEQVFDKGTQRCSKTHKQALLPPRDSTLETASLNTFLFILLEILTRIIPHPTRYFDLFSLKTSWEPVHVIPFHNE